LGRGYFRRRDGFHVVTTLAGRSSRTIQRLSAVGARSPSLAPAMWPSRSENRDFHWSRRPSLWISARVFATSLPEGGAEHQSISTPTRYRPPTPPTRSNARSSNAACPSSMAAIHGLANRLRTPRHAFMSAGRPASSRRTTPRFLVEGQSGRRTVPWSGFRC